MQCCFNGPGTADSRHRNHSDIFRLAFKVCVCLEKVQKEFVGHLLCRLLWAGVREQGAPPV